MKYFEPQQKAAKLEPNDKRMKHTTADGDNQHAHRKHTNKNRNRASHPEDLPPTQIITVTNCLLSQYKHPELSSKMPPSPVGLNSCCCHSVAALADLEPAIAPRRVLVVNAGRCQRLRGESEAPKSSWRQHISDTNELF